MQRLPDPQPRRPKKGFASLSPERQREIASLGGRAVHAKGTGHEFTSEEAKAASRLAADVRAHRKAEAIANGTYHPKTYFKRCPHMEALEGSELRCTLAPGHAGAHVMGPRPPGRAPASYAAPKPRPPSDPMRVDPTSAERLRSALTAQNALSDAEATA